MYSCELCTDAAYDCDDRVSFAPNKLAPSFHAMHSRTSPTGNNNHFICDTTFLNSVSERTVT